VKICIILPYANPHDTGWIDEFIAISNHQVTVGIVNSVDKYRKGHFAEVDDKKGYFYFFKNRGFKKKFYKEAKKCDYLITLGIFEKWFFELIFFVPNVQRIYVLSEPVRPGSTGKLWVRKCYGFVLTIIKRSSIFSILCIGGELVKSQYLLIGFKNALFYQFGHFPFLHLTQKNISSNIPVIKFIFVGQLIARKGIDILLKAIDYLQKKYENWEFLIIGNGNFQDEIIKIKENEKRITYVDNIDDPTMMNRYFNDHHILFLPSYFDGWGAVVNEALSGSCSLFLSKEVFAGSVLLEDNKNGFSFSPKNINDVFLIIDKYFEDPEILLDHFRKSEEIFKEWNCENAAISFENLLNGQSNCQNKSLLKRL